MKYFVLYADQKQPLAPYEGGKKCSSIDKAAEICETFWYPNKTIISDEVVFSPDGDIKYKEYDTKGVEIGAISARMLAGEAEALLTQDATIPINYECYGEVYFPVPRRISKDQAKAYIEKHWEDVPAPSGSPVSGSEELNEDRWEDIDPFECGCKIR